MNALDRRAADLRDVFQEIIRQQKALHSAASSGTRDALSPQELRLVETLGEKGPRIMRELAEDLGVAVNTVTGIVDELEKMRLVQRTKSAEDRRIIRVELTDAGRATHRESAELYLRFMRGMLGSLTEDEQEIFMVLFRKIARAGRSEVQHLSAPTPES